jgi:biotin carboxylase
MKKLLLVGGSHADIPIIKAAKALNYYVITTGNNPNDLGHKYADEFYSVDYSQKEDILKLAQKLNIDAICPSANDFSALSCAYTAQKLNLMGFDTYDTSQIIHHKNKFRNFALKHNITVPKAITITKQSNLDNINLEFPLIVKPIDLSGGKGITKVTNTSHLEKAVKNAFDATKSNQIVIEEFITGSNHGYCTLIKNKKIVFAFMDDEHYFLNPYLVSGASTSLHYNTHITNKLNKELEKLAALLNLKDGLLHVQFILHNNTPYIIEICRRTPGDLYVDFVKYATEYNLPQAIIKAFTQEIVEPYEIKTLNYITRHCVMGDKKGQIKSIKYGKFKNKIFDKMTFYKPGDYIQNPMTYKAEIDFIKYDNKQQMQSMQTEIISNIKIEYLK